MRHSTITLDDGPLRARRLARHRRRTRQAAPAAGPDASTEAARMTGTDAIPLTQSGSGYEQRHGTGRGGFWRFGAG